MITVVGIGADGWSGLGAQAQEAIAAAEVIVGSERQLALVPDLGAVKRAWPSPIDSLLDELAQGCNGTGVCVLASGDPMLHGIGATLARRLSPERLIVLPHVSAFALACARLGWPEAEVGLVRSAASAVPLLQPGRRIVFFAEAARVAATLCERGFGPSRLIVLEQLGAPEERIVETTAADWDDRLVDPLHSVAVECVADPATVVLSRRPGLPDATYETDGVLTKWPVRAVTLAALRPVPGELLWDVGAGSGSIAIEWLRAEPSARAIAIEQRHDRAQRIRLNAARLGAASLLVVEAAAPQVFSRLEPPGAVFVGGGLCVPGLLDACVNTGARVVANAVTLDGERALQEARRAYGGSLTRLEVSHAEPLGSFESWRAQLPIVQWRVP